LVKISGAGVRIRGRDILAAIDLEIEPGQFWGIAGPNGSGKTTLIRLITGFQAVTSGTVEVLGRDITAWPLHELRRRIGYLPQYVQADDGFPLSAGELVLTGRAGIRGMLRRFTADDREICRAAAGELGITHLLDCPLGTLSGGERQLCHLARALAQQPELLILDEPTNNLDPRAAERFMAAVEQLHARRNLSVIVITHEIPVLPPACGHVALVSGGRLAGAGPSAALLESATLSRLYGVKITVHKSGGRHYLLRNGG
jgi:ABC-type cobalamin/Fe3+-siderophores transport system ATPase subunit